MQSIIEIILRLKNETGTVLNSIGAGVSGLSTSMSSLTAATATSNAASTSFAAALQNGAASIGAANQGVSQLEGSLQNLKSALAAALAVGFFQNLADAAAKAEVAGTVLNVVGGNAGIAKGQLAEVDKSIQKMGITAESSRKSLTTFIQSGLGGLENESLGRAADLARAAQDLAVVSGEDSSATFNRLIVNIQQMDTVGLRFMGITVQREEAEKKFATSLGKTANTLTDSERRIAFMNATMVEAAKLTGTYEDAMTNVSKQIASMPRLVNELQVSLGNNLLPAYSALVAVASDWLKESKLLADEMGRNGDGGKALADTMKGIAVAIKDSLLWLQAHSDLVVAVLKGWVAFKVIAVIGPLVLGVAGAFLKFSLALRAVAVHAALSTATVGVMQGVLLTASAAARFFFASLGPIGIALGVLTAAYALFSKTKKEDTKPLVEGSDEYKGAVKDITAQADAIEDLTQKQAEFRKQAAEARAAGDTSTAASMDKKAKEIQLEKVALRERLDSFAKQKGLSKELVKAETTASAERRAQKIKDKKDDADAEALKTARERLGIADKAGETALTKAQGNLEGFRQVYAGIIKDVMKGGESGAKALIDLRVGLEKVVEGAKGPEEIAVALETIQLAAFRATEAVNAARETLLFKGEAAALADLNKQLQGFSNGLKELKETTDLLNSLTKDSRDRNNAWSKSFIDLGFSVVSLAEAQREAASSVFTDRRYQGIVSEDIGRLETKKVKVTEVSKLELQQLAQAREASRVKFTQDLAQLESLTAKRTLLLNESEANTAQVRETVGGDQGQTEIALARGNEFTKTAITKDAAAQRLVLLKAFYESEKKSQSDALSAYQNYTKQLIQIDAEIKQTRENRATDLKALDREGMTVAEVKEDKIRELAELAAKRNQALKNQDYETAKDLALKEIALTKQLKSEGVLTREETISKLKEQYDVVDKAQEEQREATRKAREEQLAAYAQVTESVDKLAKQLEATAQAKVVSLSMEVNQESLTSAMKVVEDAFKALTVQVNVSPSSTVGFATGGMVQGAGTDTSDNLMAMVSPGEFWTKAKAVRHYGAALFHGLNNMVIPREALSMALAGPSMPRFADGGMVREAANVSMFSGPSIGGVPLTPMHEAAVTVNVGGIKSRLFGDRRNVNALVESLRRLDGTL